VLEELTRANGWYASDTLAGDAGDLRAVMDDARDGGVSMRSNFGDGAVGRLRAIYPGHALDLGVGLGQLRTPVVPGLASLVRKVYGSRSGPAPIFANLVGRHPEFGTYAFQTAAFWNAELYLHRDVDLEEVESDERGDFYVARAEVKLVLYNERDVVSHGVKAFKDDRVEFVVASKYTTTVPPGTDASDVKIEYPFPDDVEGLLLRVRQQREGGAVAAADWESGLFSEPGARPSTLLPFTEDAIDVNTGATEAEVTVSRFHHGLRPAGVGDIWYGGVASTATRFATRPPERCAVCTRAATHKCSGCMAASYCSATCQTRHWASHQRKCA
jgi:hypothetical protein